MRYLEIYAALSFCMAAILIRDWWSLSGRFREKNYIGAIVFAFIVILIVWPIPMVDGFRVRIGRAIKNRRRK